MPIQHPPLNNIPITSRPSSIGVQTQNTQGLRAAQAQANLPVMMQKAVESILKQGATSAVPGETGTTIDAQSWVRQMKQEVDNNPRLRANLMKMLSSLESAQANLDKNITDVSAPYRVASAAAILGAWALTISQGVRAYNDVKNGQSDGQFITLFSSQGAKIAAMLTTLFQTNNGETNYNLLRNYGLPNAVASLSFEFIKNQPIAIASTIVGTLAGFHSLELNAWRKNAEHRNPVSFNESDSEGLEAFKQIAQAITNDIEQADALITNMIGGTRPSGESVDRVSTSELNVLETSHRLMSDKALHLRKQAGLEIPKSQANAADKAKNGYFVALQQLIGYTSVALSKTPTDKFSSLADIMGVGSLMGMKAIGNATGNAMQQAFKDLMSLTMLWLPIQSANAIVAKKSKNGAGFLDTHQLRNIMYSIGALSTGMLTIAGPVSKLGADALGVPINAASNAYSRLFGNKQGDTSNTSVNTDDSLPSGIDRAEAETQIHAAEIPDLEAGLSAAEKAINPELDSDDESSTHEAATTIAQKMRNVKNAFTNYMKETFAVKNIEVVAIMPSKDDKTIERDRKEVVNQLNQETLQSYVDLLKGLTAPPQIPSDAISIPIEQEEVLDLDQLALVHTAAKVAAEAEAKKS
ncbi:hypothetical protein [Agarilytica rhodophyticola]|uniref:hypothetical protein n=1 Tax=Agarilytica rhodophyticola TaxID=1737490 RepID=UPI00131585AB|nr:hypothetical protein [Agarilytica rhodophyticola]